jgi:hypothetical protein
LPSVFFQALDKEALCRVQIKKTYVKEKTLQKNSLSSVKNITLGKELLCQVLFFNTVGAKAKTLPFASGLRHIAAPTEA